MRRLTFMTLVLLAALVGLVASDRSPGTTVAGEERPSDPSATTEALARRWFAAFANGGDLAVADELIAPDRVQHDTLVPSAADGPGGQRQMLLTLRTGFPDLRFAIEAVVADAETVAIRWTARGTHHGEFSGLAPSGAPVTLPGTSLFRIEGGRIVESWVTYDSHWLLLQIAEVGA